MTGDRASVRDARPADRDRIAERLRASWGATTIVSRGRARDASALPAIVAQEGVELVGLATYELAGGECELVTLDAFVPGRGVGSGLLAAVAARAAARGCRRLWLITTNDNLDAIGFYRRRGLYLAAVHRGAVRTARAMKPSIPLIGDHGIPIEDELEFELSLATG